MNMKNKLFPFLIVVIFIFIFIIFYRGLHSKNIYTPTSKIDSEIPSFSANLFYSNETISSIEIFETNKYYLLNIWSSWCVPCRQEHPLLMDLAQNKNINLMGLNEKIIFDKDGITAIEWGAFGVPESFLIYNNKVLKKYIGPLSQKQIKKIKLLVK